MKIVPALRAVFILVLLLPLIAFAWPMEDVRYYGIRPNNKAVELVFLEKLANGDGIFPFADLNAKDDVYSFCFQRQSENETYPAIECSGKKGTPTLVRYDLVAKPAPNIAKEVGRISERLNLGNVGGIYVCKLGCSGNTATVLVQWANEEGSEEGP